MGWVETALPGTEAHNPFHSGLFPWICNWSYNVNLVHMRGRTDSTTDAQTNTLLPGSPSCLMKIPCWPTDSHTILQLSGENLTSQIYKLVRKYSQFLLTPPECTLSVSFVTLNCRIGNSITGKQEAILLACNTDNPIDSLWNAGHLDTYHVKVGVWPNMSS